MDLLHGNVRKIFTKYLLAGLGGSLITSIYSIFDMAMIGQYHGPAGTAAMAVVLPIWILINSPGLLSGMGGAILYGAERSKGNSQKANEYFTASIVLSAILAVVSMTLLFTSSENLLQLFGGVDNATLALAESYIFPIKFAAPAFIFSQMLAAFLRNDGAPVTTTIATLSGGIFNMVGDYFFVFVMDMGARGAGIATAMGSYLTLIIMLSHFFKKKNTLRLIKVGNLTSKLKTIFFNGLSPIMLDATTSWGYILFNRQIMRYFGTDALAVYGTLSSVNNIAMYCAFSIGQASQPLISANLGAKYWARIRQTIKYAVYSAIIFGGFWAALTFIFPNTIISLFMSPTEAVLSIAPGIMRKFSFTFVIMSINIFAAYYFQSIMKSSMSLAVTLGRGLIINTIMIIILPAIFGGESLWFTIIVTDIVVLALTSPVIWKYSKQP